MAHYLLTGAGFGRNWGGFLADEAFEYLLGCAGILPHHRSLLWKHRQLGSGFEGVLQELRDDYIRSPGEHTAKPLQEFDKFLLGMFNTMNQGFGDLEPDKNPGLGPHPTFVRDFLCRFDAIFTLNQDTLLEQKYFGSDFLDGSKGKWFGIQSPGLLEENINGTKYASPGLFRPDDPPYTIQERIQPYFKLHGSSHWRTLNGSNLLIMAENKGTQIDGVALLDWYRSEFRTRISQADARLMIIGYSFHDENINEILCASVQKGLKLFVIDIVGLKALEAAPAIRGHAVPLIDELRDAIIGGSRRPFPASIITDHIERSKIHRFFPTWP
jgi:SIR2-like domain